MTWVRRHSWKVLLAVAVMLAIFGLTDIASGASADPAIGRALTGMSLAELQQDGPAAYRLFDFQSRVNGWSLVLIGVLLAAVIVGPYRRRESWAWLAAWTLPAWAAGVPLFYLVAGLAPDEAPPPPAISGPIVAIVAVVLLLLDRPVTSQPRG
jgi:hypothetical protein